MGDPMMKWGKMIPITFTKDSDPKDISDAIGEFLERYGSEAGMEDTDLSAIDHGDVTKRTPDRSKRNRDSD